MASGRGGGGSLWPVVLVGTFLCCGFPVLAWRAFDGVQDDLAGMEPAAVSFLNAWRDGDRARAESAACGYARQRLDYLLRNEDLVTYGEVELDIHQGRPNDSYHAESDLTFADGRRQRYRLTLSEGRDRWLVCQVSRKDWY